MLSVDGDTLRTGLERALDLFRLQRLSDHREAEALILAVFANFGVDERRRAMLVAALIEMLPVAGDPAAETLMVSSMAAGVLVGLLIADATIPTGDLLPDHPPADL